MSKNAVKHDEPQVSLRTAAERKAYAERVGSRQANEDAKRWRELIAIPAADESLSIDQFDEVQGIIDRACGRGETLSWASFDTDVEVLVEVSAGQPLLDQFEKEAERLEAEFLKRSNEHADAILQVPIALQAKNEALVELQTLSARRDRLMKLRRQNSRVFGTANGFTAQNVGLDTDTSKAPSRVGFSI